MEIPLRRRYGGRYLTIFGLEIDLSKFAIRPTIRNNDKLDRDYIIKAVADAVSQLNTSHSVDLKNYDCLILVEVYRVSCLLRAKLVCLSCSADRFYMEERVRNQRRRPRIREVEALQSVRNLSSNGPRRILT